MTRYVATYLFCVLVSFLVACNKDPKNLGDKILNDKDVDKIEEEKIKKDDQLKKASSDLERLSSELDKYKISRELLEKEKRKVADLERKIEQEKLNKNQISKNGTQNNQNNSSNEDLQKKIEDLEKLLRESLIDRNNAENNFSVYKNSLPITLRSDFESELLGIWTYSAHSCSDGQLSTNQDLSNTFRYLTFVKNVNSMAMGFSSGQESTNAVPDKDGFQLSSYNLTDLSYKDTYYVAAILTESTAQPITIALKKGSVNVILEGQAGVFSGMCDNNSVKAFFTKLSDRW